MKKKLPYPEERGRTHWPGCYRVQKHHNCAVQKVDRLMEEFEKIFEIADDPGGAMDGGTDGINSNIGVLALIRDMTENILEREKDE